MGSLLCLNYKALNPDFIARSFQEVLHVEVQENINEQGWYLAALSEECRSNRKREAERHQFHVLPPTASLPCSNMVLTDLSASTRTQTRLDPASQSLKDQRFSFHHIYQCSSFIHTTEQLESEPVNPNTQSKALVGDRQTRATCTQTINYSLYKPPRPAKSLLPIPSQLVSSKPSKPVLVFIQD